MRIETKEILLKTGKMCVLRSPEVEDAERLIAFLKGIAGESPFLVRYPEEVTMTVEEEVKMINGLNESRNSLMIVGEVDGRLAGTCSLAAVSSRMRVRHRCNLSIGIYEEFTGQGIGKVMFTELVAEAEKMGFEQAELEVVARNERAIALYKKLGFEPVGCIPRAMKQKDGSYDDFIKMVKDISYESSET